MVGEGEGALAMFGANNEERGEGGREGMRNEEVSQQSAGRGRTGSKASTFALLSDRGRS